MPNFNGLRDQIQRAAAATAKLAVETGLTVTQIFKDPERRKKLMSQISGAQTSAAIVHLTAIKKALAQEGMAELQFKRGFRPHDIPEEEFESSNEFSSYIESSVKNLEKDVESFYKNIIIFDESIADVLSIQAELDNLADDYQIKNRLIAENAVSQYENQGLLDKNDLSYIFDLNPDYRLNKEPSATEDNVDAIFAELSEIIPAPDKVNGEEIDPILSEEYQESLFRVSQLLADKGFSRDDLKSNPDIRQSLTPIFRPTGHSWLDEKQALLTASRKTGNELLERQNKCIERAEKVADTLKPAADNLASALLFAIDTTTDLNHYPALSKPQFMGIQQVGSELNQAQSVMGTDISRAQACQDTVKIYRSIWSSLATNMSPVFGRRNKKEEEQELKETIQEEAQTEAQRNSRRRPQMSLRPSTHTH